MYSARVTRDVEISMDRQVACLICLLREAEVRAEELLKPTTEISFSMDNMSGCVVTNEAYGHMYGTAYVRSSYT